MINSMLALLVAVVAAPTGDDGMAKAERVVAAIKGEAQFQDGDFVHPLAAADKAALRRFAPCKTKVIGYALKPDPTEADTYTQDLNWVTVEMGCKGVSPETPVAISLHLKDGKIATIETHNADLMRGN